MADASERDREINIQGGSYQPTEKYADNMIKTSKYTPASFIPKNLYEQLHKFGNAYFLCISVIMYLGEKTPLFVGTIKAFSTLGLLVIMMSITAAMALLDDIRRKEADEEINNAKAKRLKPNREVVDSKWGEVKVGDVLLVKEDEEFPADVVPMYCSGEGGHCYVSTANLDGETNLKLKAASPASQKLLERNLAAGKIPDTKLVEGIKIIAESPNANIHDFKGSIAVLDGTRKLEESLGAKQLLMRGTVLRNTAVTVGVVVYTGADTRMVRNSRPSPLKQSNLERVTNVAMGLILVSQALLALVSDLCHFATQDEFTEYWYLKTPSIILPGLVGYWLTFFTLYSNLMPISLYPTAEFCNAFQSYCIKNDQYMVYKEEGFNDGVGFSAKARTSNLCHELGQVQYIFSDKTGTLTQNVMELKRLSIAGRQYGEMTNAKKGFTGAGDLETSRRNNDRDMIDGFLEVLAVSHTVMASKNADGSLKYEAESPDEFALVKAAGDLGWRFTDRRGDTMTCEYRSPGKEVIPRTHTVLATNEFDSARKRMSVIVKRDDDQYLLLVKGADNVMMERAARKETILNQHLKEFSQQGLRTLVIARRKLEAAEVSAWKAKYDQAQRETKDRGTKLANVAEEIEKNLEILGATAIEDKLQDKVPEAIEKIRQAGIKLWVLTGDKLETARNIGFSTRVLNSEMEILTLDPEEGDTDLEAGDRRLGAKPLEKRGIMVTGKMLTQLLNDPGKKKQFTELADKCAVLIACRVSPLQKAEMVRLVRERPREMTKSPPVTLAIGDGANDVPMIQEAQVGIGIAGREGRQAVNNSDFAIGQFQYLQRLLFVHGRWNYRRACKFTLFTFWRNTVQVLMSFYFSFVSGYSGSNLFEDWVRLSFNLICSLPILAVGCFDQDVSHEMALRKPELYEVGRRGKDLGLKKVTYTLGAAVLHSATLFIVTTFSFPSLDLSNSGDYYTFGTAVYTCLIIDVTYRAFFITETHNKYTVGTLFVSLVGYVIYLIIYTESKFIVNLLEPNMFHVARRMSKTGYFWVCVLTVPGIAMVIDIFITFLNHRFFPDKREQVERNEERSNNKSDASLGLLTESNSNGLPDSVTEESATSWSKANPEDAKLVDLSDRAQQNVPSIRIGLSKGRYVKKISTVAGFVFVSIGGFCWFLSQNSKQLRITYFDESKGRSPYTSWAFGSAPMWSTVEEKISVPDSSCKSQGAEVRPRKCTHTIRVPEAMRPPILVYYALGPYYQNFNDYLKSEISKELMGHEVSASLREAKCPWDRTRITASGSDIIPCGMKATSLFNDSYTLHGVDLSKEKLAWTSDVDRYHNLKNYRHRKGTSWLYQRYPKTVDKDEGVKSEAFNVWMRPSSMPRIWNPYGLVFEEVPAGNLTITIDDRYPPPTGTYKTVVITEFSEMFGARHSGFGALLVFSGIVCFLIACVTCFAEFVPETCCKTCDDFVDQYFE